MRATEEKITEFVHSSATPQLMVLAAVAALYAALRSGGIDAWRLMKGVGLPSPGLWVSGEALSALCAVALVGAVAVVMVVLNSRYNMLRDMTRLPEGLFIVMMAAQPQVSLQLGGGLMIALTVTLAMLALYRTYNRPARTRPVFLAFVLLAAMSLTQYGCIAYIPLFLMGIAQMRIFGWRTATAALLGVVTPVWILVAFGVIGPGDFRGPQFVNAVGELSGGAQVQFYAAAAFTALAGITLSVLNLMKVLSYNSRSRAYNGFVVVLLIGTCCLMCVDYTNLPAYVPLLCACTAYQCAQYFLINIKRRGYIAVLGMTAVYAGLFVWWMAVA